LYEGQFLLVVHADFLLVMLSPYLMIILALPTGQVLAKILPTRRWSVFGWSFTLNPGPICGFFLFFCFFYPDVELNWWGNLVASTTADELGTPLKTLPPGQTFGPSTWH
jgi:hypothetical protein